MSKLRHHHPKKILPFIGELRVLQINRSLSNRIDTNQNRFNDALMGLSQALLQTAECVDSRHAPHNAASDKEKIKQQVSTELRRSKSPVRSSASLSASSQSAMDLGFVTERILSLSFPQGTEGHAHRSGLRQAATMLQTKHGENYMLFNLCQPRREINKWNRRVLDVGWPDALAPPLERLCSICRALDSWLQADPQHVAVLYSKTGLERIGVIVAAYYKYTGLSGSQDQSLDRFAMQQFLSDRVGGLQRPSDKRYIEYFGGLLTGTIQVNSSPLFLNHVTVLGVPSFESSGGCRPFFKVYQGSVILYTSPIYHVADSAKHFTMSIEKGIQLRGDILIKCYHRHGKPNNNRETIFSVQFHTCAVADHMLVFHRQDLDDACQDLRFPLDGSVQLHFSSGEDQRSLASNFLTTCSFEASSNDPVARWDSYETLEPSQEEDDISEIDQGIGSHTFGPVDGSLYATILKRKTPPPTTPLLCLKSDSVSVGPVAHVHFVNSPHVASTDSGISSAGIRRETHLSGSSASPPHSGHSAESAAVFSDPSPSPSPECFSGEAPKMPSRMETRADVHHGSPPAGSGAAPSLVATTELDQLLTGMLMNVQNIPDIRPSQTKHLHASDIDVDSIQVNFDLPSQPAAAPQKNYIYESDTVRRVSHSNMGKSSATTDTTAVREIPYHAREDSRPFTYGVVNGNGSAPPSPSIHRRNSKETLQQPAKGLQSPSLVRKFSNGGLTTTPQSTRKISDSQTPGPFNLSTSLMNTPNSQPVATSSPRLDTRSAASVSTTMSLEETIQDISTSSESNRYTNDSAGLTWLQRQQQKLRERKESLRLADRQPKERQLISELRAAQVSKTQGPPEEGDISDATWVSELQSSRETSPDTFSTPLTIATNYGQNYQAKNGTLPVGTTPLTTQRSASLERTGQYASVQQQLEEQQRRTLSRQKSDLSHDRERPFVAVKRAHELQKVNSDNQGQMASNSARNLLTSAPFGYVGYRPSANGSHDLSDGLLTTVNDGNSTLVSATNDTGARIDTLERLLHALRTELPDPAFLMRSANTTNKETRLSVTFAEETPSPRSSLNSDSYPYPTPVTRKLTQALLNNPFPKDSSITSWNSSANGEDFTGIARPVTPGFPVVPRTPYLNAHHSFLDTPTTPTSGAGLPPKSPTTQRRTPGLASPALSQPLYSAKPLRKWPSNTSVSSKDRSPSPSSSVYLGQSRRSSLLSTSGSEPHEVSSAHVNFVKDTSKFWYKPNIAREDAINMLKDKAPGTFVVRDSNSFPGAFGLALKVATPPPHAANKNPTDPASELVRHFLIEPTSKGVRIKGCTNEPVFSSLSALIYQHSVTPLALPCKLNLPDTDVGTDVFDSGAVSPTTHLLMQGAACNVLYLITVDTESLTGPQAIQRAMTNLLDCRPLPVPSVVHFKVSAQGITLTDSERKLFFRRHYPVTTVSYCGLDPEDRRWNQKSEETGLPISSNRCFGFVARKQGSKTDNQCHIFAELEPEQPATAIVNFVTKVMMNTTQPRNHV